MKDGGMVRGTISELSPKKSVTIVTVTGETRKIAMADVTYAGPAADAPRDAAKPAAQTKGATKRPDGQGPIRPFTTVHGPEARLHLTGEPGLTFHRRSGSATASGFGKTVVAEGYDELCAAPCDVSLPAGTYTLALSRGTKEAIPGSDPVKVPAGQSTVKGTYVDNSGTRTAGWLVMGAGFAVGTYFLVAAMGDASDGEKDNSKITISLVTIAVGSGVGIALATQADKSTFTVTPGAPKSATRSPEARVDAKSRLRALQGVTATARF